MARPRNSCVQVVNRFASEYQNTMPSATGDNMKHSGFNWYAANTNSADATTTKAVASAALIAPRGISRLAVLGFSASNRRSTRRLNPIAAERAITIATRIHPTVVHVTAV